MPGCVPECPHGQKRRSGSRTAPRRDRRQCPLVAQGCLIRPLRNGSAHWGAPAAHTLAGKVVGAAESDPSPTPTVHRRSRDDVDLCGARGAILVPTTTILRASFNPLRGRGQRLFWDLTGEAALEERSDSAQAGTFPCPHLSIGVASRSPPSGDLGRPMLGARAPGSASRQRVERSHYEASASTKGTFI